jgi:hypothetical protein
MLGQLTLSRFSEHPQGIWVPICALKCSKATFCLSSWEIGTPTFDCKEWIQFFFFLWLATMWKYFVLASPSIIQICLDLCFALHLSIAANHKILDLSSLIKLISDTKSCLFSYTFSSWLITSLQTVRAILPFWNDGSRPHFKGFSCSFQFYVQDPKGILVQDHRFLLGFLHTVFEAK